MEERDFLHEICLTVLCVSKDVKFAGVVDSNGKLLMGEYRKNIQGPLVNKSDSINTQKSNSFFLSYLAPAIKGRNFDLEPGKVHFKLTEFDNVKLATTSLTNRNDRYLCVYLESSSTSYQEIISKVIESI
jgi:hypothetical protein